MRRYAQDTWRLVTQDQGVSIVTRVCAGVLLELMYQVLSETVAHYLQECKAENHMTREAACHCIAELARKLPIKDHVTTLLDMLLICLQDPSWYHIQ